jgi:hypothetical protein
MLKEVEVNFLVHKNSFDNIYLKLLNHYNFSSRSNTIFLTLIGNSKWYNGTLFS